MMRRFIRKIPGSQIDMNTMLILSACAGILAVSITLPHPDIRSAQAPVQGAMLTGLPRLTDTTNPAAETDAVVDTVSTKAGDDFIVEKSSGIDKRFEPVIRRLIDEGWPKEWLEARFGDRRTVFIPKMAIVKPRSGGGASSSAYAWVNTSESADACRKFIEKYEGIFDKVEERYDVNREVIAALMRCETRHGSVTGDYHVFSVYASMALMPEKEFLDESIEKGRETLKARKLSSSKINSELDWIRSRAASRSKWAYRELVNLLKIDRQGHTDAMGLYGSWAGAFGWSQFLPSSYLSRAVDGDGDGTIDLFNASDAIHSVANYLKKAGYRSGNASRCKKALRSYNPSTPYVESIYALSERVRKAMAAR